MRILDQIIHPYRPITEKEIKRESFHSEILKGYIVYFFKEDSSWDRHKYHLAACAYRNGRYIIHQEGYRKKDLPLDEEVFERFREGIGRLVFTEEEILSPKPSLSEYRRKKEFLEHLYIKQVDHLPLEDAPHYQNYSHADALVFDPVSSCLLQSDQKDFVTRHIWLYQELQKLYRPTIFPVDAQLNPTALAYVYAQTIPLADPEDPFLEEAKAYLKKNGGKEARDMYAYGSRDTAIKLVMGDCVAKPSMKKLLEMANQRGDAEFAAILLDKMQGKTAASSRFSI